MGFPSYKTVKRWTKEEFSRIGLSMDLFNGSLLSIQKLFEYFINKDFKNVKIVLAVDAAGVKPNVVIHKNGKIDGLLDGVEIDPDEIIEIKKSLETFNAFIEANKTDIIHYYFVFYACPIDSKRGGFPILIKPKNNGSADTDLVGDFEEIYLECGELQIDIIGLTFDGD